MKIIVDMNLSPGWVDVLRAEAFDAVHWSHVGPHDSPDEYIVDHAAQTGSVILTRDLDFGAHLALSGRSSPSVVQLRSGRASPSRYAGSVLKALVEARDALRKGALVIVDLDSIRVRVLPFPQTPKSE